MEESISLILYAEYPIFLFHPRIRLIQFYIKLPFEYLLFYCIPLL